MQVCRKDTFYTTIDLASSVSAGGVMDASTVLWWMRQPDDARAVFANGGQQIAQALQDFAVWMQDRGDTDTVRVWGNGAAFDNVILASAYRACRLPVPWRYYNDRCYRTVKAQHPATELRRFGTHHNALDDAESQARHLLAMLTADTVTRVFP